MKRQAILLLAVSGIALAGCATRVDRAAQSPLNPGTIGGPEDMRIGPPPPASPDRVRIPAGSTKAEESDVSRIRSDALKESAQSYGSQMGYARRAWEISGRLQDRAGDLSQVFDFARVVSTAPVKAGVIVPPVVSRSFDAFTTDNEGREASVADEYLTIVRAGRIAPVAPTWRDYLVLSTHEPDKPHQSLLPADGNERGLFDGWFREGWQAGTALADAEFSERIDRLERDYTGMLQYRRLVDLGMMDRMVLADADFGVTGENGEMRIGSRTVRIVSDAAFQTDPARWKVRSVSARDALIVDTGEIPPLSADLN
ncbi:type IV secretion system DotC family protein [Cereibacter sphaeroides]|uniref:type IV secretory system conjugative DNA transfer family protein n=1 Tax=Cereibacter sphaeroides TaxID=1063 RepID=UPI001F479B61|nr:type IV secretory system conjugative DNA transfer family protein [Cereibacter sphaeroides]MCE6959681.1 type IV secretion system DotC family protein [Cereibacter sphaeroides]MCE6974458.1 type IV secretion system DotC family protein [Cereibacter sphaeroides]